MPLMLFHWYHHDFSGARNPSNRNCLYTVAIVDPFRWDHPRGSGTATAHLAIRGTRDAGTSAQRVSSEALNPPPPPGSSSSTNSPTSEHSTYFPARHFS